MRPNGIIRKTDELGRIVLPMFLRHSLDIGSKDGIEFFVENDRIILQKYQPSCVFCGNFQETGRYKGKHVCRECAAAINTTKNAKA